jgi:hypothetical protein
VEPKQYFDDSYCAMANDGLQSCAQTADFLSKCKDCGLEVGNEIAANERHKAFLEQFKKNFFPNQP